MIDIKTTGFIEGIFSLMKGSDGVVLLLTDGANQDLSVRITLSHDQLVNLLRLSEIPGQFTGDRHEPRKN